MEALGHIKTQIGSFPLSLLRYPNIEFIWHMPSFLGKVALLSIYFRCYRNLLNQTESYVCFLIPNNWTKAPGLFAHELETALYP